MQRRAQPGQVFFATSFKDHKLPAGRPGLQNELKSGTEGPLETGPRHSPEQGSASVVTTRRAAINTAKKAARLLRVSEPGQIDMRLRLQIFRNAGNPFIRGTTGDGYFLFVSFGQKGP